MRVMAMAGAPWGQALGDTAGHWRDERLAAVRLGCGHRVPSDTRAYPCVPARWTLHTREVLGSIQVRPSRESARARARDAARSAQIFCSHGATRSPCGRRATRARTASRTATRRERDCSSTASANSTRSTRDPSPCQRGVNARLSNVADRVQPPAMIPLNHAVSSGPVEQRPPPASFHTREVLGSIQSAPIPRKPAQPSRLRAPRPQCAGSSFSARGAYGERQLLARSPDRRLAGSSTRTRSPASAPSSQARPWSSSPGTRGPRETGVVVVRLWRRVDWARSRPSS